MKHAGWIAGTTMLLLLFAAWEIIYHLKGNELAVEVAGTCIFLVWAAVAWRLCKWADSENKIARDRAEKNVGQSIENKSNH